MTFNKFTKSWEIISLIACSNDRITPDDLHHEARFRSFHFLPIFHRTLTWKRASERRESKLCKIDMKIVIWPYRLCHVNFLVLYKQTHVSTFIRFGEVPCAASYAIIKQCVQALITTYFAHLLKIWYHSRAVTNVSPYPTPWVFMIVISASTIILSSSIKPCKNMYITWKPFLTLYWEDFLYFFTRFN